MSKIFKVVAMIGIAVSMAWGSQPPYPYYIVTPGENISEFNAVRFLGSVDAEPMYFDVAIGGIQDVIDAIRANASGKDCIIEFDGGMVGANGITCRGGSCPLDLGTQRIVFTNSFDCPEGVVCDPPMPWGKIMINGRITSKFGSAFDEFAGVISIDENVSVEISGCVENTANIAITEDCDPNDRNCPLISVQRVLRNAIGKAGKGTITIKNSNIVAHGGTAIESNGAARVIVEQGANIRSNRGVAISVSRMNNYLSWGQDDTTLIINGGNISGYGAVFAQAGNIYINGGTLTAIPPDYEENWNSLSGAAVISNGDYLYLGGSPKINGAIFTDNKGLYVKNGFNPDDRIYELLGDYPEDDIVVFDGKDFLANFTLSAKTLQAVQYLYISGNDLRATFDQNKVSIAPRAGRQTASKFAFAGISNGQINLHLQAGNYTVELYNLQGRMIRRVNINAVNGVNATGLRTNNLSRGTFILDVKQAGNSVLKQKIAVR